jgi:hypothetical protein
MKNHDIAFIQSKAEVDQYIVFAAEEMIFSLLDELFPPKFVPFPDGRTMPEFGWLSRLGDRDE